MKICPKYIPLSKGNFLLSASYEQNRPPLPRISNLLFIFMASNLTIYTL